MQINNKLISRAHNNITIKNGFVQKTSSEVSKLKSELLWLENMSRNIYIPAVNEIENGYEIRYINGHNLGEVFWDLDFHEKKSVINIMFDFIIKNKRDILKFEKFKTLNKELLIEKCKSRFEIVLKNEKWAQHKEILSTYLKAMETQISKIDATSFGIMHGDLFFGNSLYDGLRIYFIDPRGYDDENEIYGSIYYDVIKLAHSIHGLYDQIVFAKTNHKDHKRINGFFFRKVKRIFGWDKDLILLGEMGLFLSMLPLHSDSEERQNDLFNTALKIYKEIEWKNLL